MTTFFFVVYETKIIEWALITATCHDCYCIAKYFAGWGWTLNSPAVEPSRRLILLMTIARPLKCNKVAKKTIKSYFISSIIVVCPIAQWDVPIKLTAVKHVALRKEMLSSFVSSNLIGLDLFFYSWNSDLKSF